MDKVTVAYIHAAVRAIESADIGRPLRYFAHKSELEWAKKNYPGMEIVEVKPIPRSSTK